MSGRAGEGRDPFWQLSQLSNVELLEGLHACVGRSRQLLARVVAHLGEVEERRLHLRDGCGSMFDYCVRRLAMSEDEACRRIEVARLARRFPELYPALARGELSLTVAALLKPVLAQENAADLLAAVSRCTVRQAREVLAARFPSPDVPSMIRKLPEPRPMQPALSATLPATALAGASHSSLEAAPAPDPAGPARGTPVSRSRIEPLSAARYKIQFTADLALKNKLELARDLVRHAVPNGDDAIILERALDLLIERHMKRRFGARTRESTTRSSVTGDTRAISRATRRNVLERDGLRCSWVGDSGERCEARAWLELDHRQPRGKSGGSEPENLRVLCRNHNQWSAELQFGREHVERKQHPDGTAVGSTSAAPIDARARRCEARAAQRADGLDNESEQE
jgi:hypothetical protein